MQIFWKWIKIIYNKTITSISFVPALIALGFLLLAFLMILFDFSEAGKAIKSNPNWIKLRDPNTARSIISAIVGGMLTLTVFSFSMVMILLNQAASQMSNRVLDKLIGNRFQQFVLGFYIGTIVYALFLLTSIRDSESGINVPAISIYLLIIFTVGNIFLFIYFLHFITQSVKYDTIIYKIFDDTIFALQNHCTLKTIEEPTTTKGPAIIVNAHKTGIYQGFDMKPLIEICALYNITITSYYPLAPLCCKTTLY